MKELIIQNIKWQKNWKVLWLSFFLTAISLIVVFIVPFDTTKDNFYLYLILYCLGMSSFSELRFLKNVDFTQLVVINQSKYKKSINLFLSNFIATKLIYFLIFILAYLIRSEILSGFFLIFFIYNSLCFSIASFCLIHVSRRNKTISIISKQLLMLIAFIPLSIMIIKGLDEFVVKNYFLFQLSFSILLTNLMVISLYMYNRMLYTKPIYDLEIIEKYNKKYWY